MKLPSLQTLWNGLWNVLIRFPLQSTLILIAGGLWLMTTYTPEATDQESTIEIIILCNLAFTLSLSANLFGESRNYSPSRSILIQVAALLPAVVLFAVLDPFRLSTDSIRIALSLLAGHILLSFSICSDRLSVFHFWHFNKALFLRFLTGILFSVILYAGITIALLSIQTLFDFRFDGELFFRLFILISVWFNSIFFLAGIPALPNSNTGAPSLETNYPKILKIFTQYVLIPLLTVYFAILIVYELKITFSFELPKGTVAYLVLGYSFFGILSYLLIYPLKDGKGNEWIRYYSKLFFWLMLPLLVLLLIAIGVRVADYGLTEKRYIIIALALWLSIVSVHFSLSRSPRLELIPMSLFLVLLVAVVGPQSATALSRMSQQSRLAKFIEPTQADSLMQKESIVRYLVDFHGLESLQRHSERNLEEIQQRIEEPGTTYLPRWQKKQQARDSAYHLLNVEFTAYDNGQTIYVNSNKKLTSSKGFDFIYWFEHANDQIETASGTVSIITRESQLLIEFPELDTIAFDLKSLETEMQNRYKDPLSKPHFVRQGPNHTYAVPQPWLTLRDSSSYHVVELRLQSFSFAARPSRQETKVTPFARGFLLIKRPDLKASH